MSFPEFMFREKNRIPASQQNTPDIEGYYYTANDGSQMAFWIYKADRISKEHMHDYDEYMICVEGEYIVTINGEELFFMKVMRWSSFTLWEEGSNGIYQ